MIRAKFLRFQIYWMVVTFPTCLLCLSENHEPTEPGERRRYGREFLLALQFVGASIQKTQGLPCINGVILDKVGGV